LTCPVIIGHSASVDSVACSPDGRKLLTGSMDNTTILWSCGMPNRGRSFTGLALT
jgi:WD40 repeat protein